MRKRLTVNFLMSKKFTGWQVTKKQKIKRRCCRVSVQNAQLTQRWTPENGEAADVRLAPRFDGRSQHGEFTRGVSPCAMGGLLRRDLGGSLLNELPQL